jgi:hypothetical protein
MDELGLITLFFYQSCKMDGISRFNLKNKIN